MKKTISIFLFLFSTLLCFYSEGQNLILKAQGENATETQTLDSLNYTSVHQNYKYLNDEVKLIINKLQKNGYLDVVLTSNNKRNDSTYVATFNLKKKYYYIYIYNYDHLFSKYDLEITSDNIEDDYFVIPIPEIENTLNSLNELLIAKGSPFSSLKLRQIEKIKDNNLRANLDFDNQQKRTIDTVIVKGYDKFPKSYLKHFLNLKHEQVFNLSDITDKTSKLNQLTFATQTKSPEVLFTKDKTSVYLYLEKKKSNSFDGFLGFGTNEETNKIEFDGYLNLLLNNNLNYGESLSLQYKSDKNEQKTLDINVELPYIFKLPIGISANLNLFKKDSSFTNVSQNIKLNYQINHNHRVDIGYTNTNSNVLSTNILENTNDFSSNFLTSSYIFSKKSTLAFSNEYNLFSNLTLGMGKRKNESLQTDQFLASLSSYKLFKLNTQNNIFINLTLKGLISDSYLENELFRFGGINSIRGFEENSLVASKFGVLNTEYRYNISSSLYIHSIIDASYFENDVTYSKEKLFGFGFGFGLKTRAGLFKFIYANGKTENQKFNLSNSKIHISLSTFF